jgi:hypothetical protein
LRANFFVSSHQFDAPADGMGGGEIEPTDRMLAI